MAATGKFYLVRTTNAGVHCGRLRAMTDRSVVLADARRIWRWRGANTLNELSQHGCEIAWSRISEPVPEIELLDAIELISCSETACENLVRSRWG